MCVPVCRRLKNVNIQCITRSRVVPCFGTGGRGGVKKKIRFVRGTYMLIRCVTVAVRRVAPSEKISELSFLFCVYILKVVRADSVVKHDSYSDSSHDYSRARATPNTHAYAYIPMHTHARTHARTHIRSLTHTNTLTHKHVRTHTRPT